MSDEIKREAAHTPTYRWLRDTTLEERSWPEDYPHENGAYSNTCRAGCGRAFVGHKRRMVCKVCSTESAPDLAADSERLKSALTKINDIRNSIIGCQKVNWSEHVYPLVAALDAAGFEGASYEVARDQIGTLLERTNKAEAEVERLRKSERDNEAQLVRIAACIGKDARQAPDHDRTIAGAAIAEVERLRADLDAERRKVKALRSASVGSRGWLVEWRYHGSVQWLYLWSAAGGGFSFTADASMALRLARREDAEAVLEWARDTDSRRGLHSSTFLVTEHVWESAALASTEGAAK